MNFRDVQAYYSRDDIQAELLRISEGREVVGVFRDGAFSKRPNTLVYPKDITSLVREGAVAFHGSLERWSNPMSVGSQNYEKGRMGWDLVLDMDCEETEHGKAAVRAFMWSLKKHGVKSISVKFTGGTGFHMAVPFEAFPEAVDYKKTSAQYPELARKIAMYLRMFTRERLEKELLSRWNEEQLAEQSGRKIEEFLTPDGIDPYRIVDVDPILISPRHLFRLPYSLHEKSGLVSLTLRPGELDGFRREDAEPGKVRIVRKFLAAAEPGEASLLVTEAVDWAVKHRKERTHTHSRAVPRKAIPIELAPPCIKNILKGLSDGKKRSLLVLINYLASAGWKWEKITEALLDWNTRNTPQLRDNYIRGQIRWHMNRPKAMPPPSCTNPGYYISIGVCEPDKICGGSKKTIKNPINYPFSRMRKKKS